MNTRPLGADNPEQIGQRGTNEYIQCLSQARGDHPAKAGRKKIPSDFTSRTEQTTLSSQITYGGRLQRFT